MCSLVGRARAAPG